MLVYLDNGENVKKHPNENFGRELLELFTMGVGNYTEHDVREAARAFTGWTNDVLAFKFDADQHDFGEKTFLGRTGTAQRRGHHRHHPRAAGHRRVRGRRSSIGTSCARRSPRSVRTRAGRTFRESGYEMKPLLKRIFLSKDFYSPPSYATQIKSPVHLVVSTYRKMGLREVPTIPGLRPHDRRPRTGAVRSAQRGGLGRRPHVDHAVDAAAARQPVPRRAVPRRQGLPSARSRRCRRPTRASGSGWLRA